MCIYNIGEMTGKIELIGMEFKVCHGCLEIERQIPNLFVVDFRGEAEMTGAVKEDDLDGTVDYSRVYGIISREMNIPSRLMEHVAGRIVEAIAREIPELKVFEVSIAKQRPPVEGVVAWSRVTLSYPY